MIFFVACRWEYHSFTNVATAGGSNLNSGLGTAGAVNSTIWYRVVWSSTMDSMGSFNISLPSECTDFFQNGKRTLVNPESDLNPTDSLDKVHRDRWRD
jgi:hypothetical protein